MKTTKTSSVSVGGKSGDNTLTIDKRYFLILKHNPHKLRSLFREITKGTGIKEKEFINRLKSNFRDSDYKNKTYDEMNSVLIDKVINPIIDKYK